MIVSVTQPLTFLDSHRVTVLGFLYTSELEQLPELQG